MTNTPQVNYRMLTPLIRIKINTKQKIQFPLNNNLKIIINDSTVFQQWNNAPLPDGKIIQMFPGMAGMSFNYNPLLFGLFSYVKDYPEDATKTLDNLLKGFALFKTTEQTKFKMGPRWVQTLTSTPLVVNVNIRGSDDWLEFTGKNYEMELSELNEFRDFYALLEPQLKMITDRKFLQALEFFSKATRISDSVEKFVFLSVAFEFLFSKESDELSYRFSNRIALLLGSNSEDRKRIGKIVKNVIYSQRSKIIHGASVVPPPTDILQYFFEIMRVSLLRFTSLYHTKHVDPISELDSFLLLQDTAIYEKFSHDAKMLFDNISNLQFYTTRTKIN